jgi:hypothetical protein
MKLFSTSALLVAATATASANFPLLQYVPCSAIPGCQIDANGNVEYVDDANDGSRRRRRSTQTKKEARKARKGNDKRSDGYLSVKSDIEHGRFKKIIKAHGAQSIVDPWGLDQKELFILHNILKEGTPLTGKQLLNKLDATGDINPAELNEFVLRQQKLLKGARETNSYQAENLAMVGFEAPDSAFVPEEDVPVMEQPVVNDVPDVFEPVFAEENRPTRMPHLNAHYPPEAFLTPQEAAHRLNQPVKPVLSNMPKFYSPPKPTTNRPTQTGPNGVKFYTPPEAPPRQATLPPQPAPVPNKPFLRGFNGIPGTSNVKLIAPINLKSAMLAGRGLPQKAIKPKNEPQPHFVHANRQHYKVEELDYLSKEAKAVFVNIRKQMDVYNQLVDLIGKAKSELKNDQKLAAVAQQAANIQQPPTQRAPLGARGPRGRPMNQQGMSPVPSMRNPQPPNPQMAAAINRKNDEVLASLRKRNNDIVRAEKEAERKRTQAQERADHHHQQLMQRNAHNDDMLARVTAGKPSLLADAREKVEEDKIDEPEQKKEYAFGPLSSMNIMTQFKIAHFLRDNDDFTNDDWETIVNSPEPSYGDIEKYYYMQQRVLRGDAIPRELNWMKKLTKSLWKGLKPDPIPMEMNYPPTQA